MKNIITALFLVTSCTIQAQYILPDYKVSKVKDGEAMIRWEPRSVDEMDDGFDLGYKVDVYIYNANKESKLLKSEKVKVAKKEDWQKAIKTPSEYNDFVEASALLLYPELMDEIEEVPNGFIDGKRNIKLGLIQYYGVYDFNITKMAGFGYDFKVDKGARYKVVVSCGNHDKYEYFIDSSVGEADLPQLIGHWGDHEVSLQWNTKASRSDWFGYNIKKSDDEFGDYVQLNNVPLVNNYDTSAVVDLQIMEHADSLEFNDHTYHYQMYGVDFFGEVSQNYKSISGSGYEKILMSPIISMADQMENNDAYIQWEMREKYIPLIDHFKIVGSPQKNGEYITFLDSLPSTSTEAYVPMKYNQNYFRVQAVPYRGKVINSTSVFVMGMDTIPPAAPVMLDASIDSTGRVAVSWHQNTEPDLWGYRIYWSNKLTHEFSVLNASPTMDTVFIDSLNLNFSVENIFYKVVAFDKRNNASEDSEIIKLKRPDIIPPAAPHIKSITTNLDSITVICQRSGSKDAILHQLFRKDLNDNFGNWELVKVYEGILKENTFAYVDTKIPVGGKKYAYTMIAYDDANLKSEPSKAKSIIVKAKEEIIEPIIAFDIVSEEDKVVLQWELDNKLNYSNILLYRGSKEHKITKYKYLDASATSFEDDIADGKSYYYFIKPSYEGQLKDCKSEILLSAAKGE